MKKYYAKEGDVIEIPRRKGKWIVEKAEMTGGQHTAFNDYHPDAWHVWARKLGEDGKYNPKNRMIKFTQNTIHFNSVIYDVRKIGKMIKIYV